MGENPSQSEAETDAETQTTAVANRLAGFWLHWEKENREREPWKSPAGVQLGKAMWTDARGDPP